MSTTRNTNVEVKTPFGFNTLYVGQLPVYTGKLRFVGIKYVPTTNLVKVEYHGKYCYISYETTDQMINKNLVNILGTLCKTIAQARLDKRYGWVN